MPLFSRRSRPPHTEHSAPGRFLRRTLLSFGGAWTPPPSGALLLSAAQDAVSIGGETAPRVLPPSSTAGTVGTEVANTVSLACDVCDVIRPFRAQHLGAPMLAKWLQGPLGRQAIRAPAPAWQPSRG